MPLSPAKAGRGFRLALLAVYVSLGLAGVAQAQFVNMKKPEAKKPPVEGVAVWYQVPPNSLAKRRAGKDELTAAHNKLPLGTKVRVTHLRNGKSVVVRITDRGIAKHGAMIDLCKEAAEKLDMIREGSARVRLEILPDETPGKTPGW